MWALVVAVFDRVGTEIRPSARRLGIMNDVVEKVYNTIAHVTLCSVCIHVLRMYVCKNGATVITKKTIFKILCM